MKLGDTKSTAFLGSGFAFPFAISPSNGGIGKQTGVTMQQALDLVKSAIFQLIYTGRGERFMARDFGTSATNMLFQSQDKFTIQRMIKTVQEAINKYEKRVILNALYIDKIVPDQGLVQIFASVTLAGSNISGNIVYPYYLDDPGVVNQSGSIGAVS